MKMRLCNIGLLALSAALLFPAPPQEARRTTFVLLRRSGKHFITRPLTESFLVLEQEEGLELKDAELAKHLQCRVETRHVSVLLQDGTLGKYPYVRLACDEGYAFRKMGDIY